MNRIAAKRPLRTALLLSATLLAGCGAIHTKNVDSWKTDQPVTHKPTKVAVLTVLPDDLIREATEVDIVKILQDKGVPAVASSRLPGMGGGIRGEIDPQAAVELLRSNDVDGVIVMFYAGGGETGDYVRADYWAEYVGSGIGYNWARPYFVDVYTIHQGPDIVNFQMNAYVESSYYDLETKKPVWRIVTEVKDVEHTDAARDVAKKIASEMKSARLD